MRQSPTERIHPEDVIDHTTPSLRSLRRSLQATLRTDAAIDAFCLDYFPTVKGEFASGMSKTQKLNLLLECVSASEILAALKDSGTVALTRYLPAPSVPSRGHAHEAPRLAAGELRNRRRLINRVRSCWIEGVLEKSLYGTVLMELGKDYRPDEILYPWDMALHNHDEQIEEIPKGKTMLDLFDDNFGELLILGAPGSGKTTMLLDLCRALLKQAESDEAQPIPVVFNLPRWASQRLPISEWLVEELALCYGVPEQLGQEWIESDRILPLLDGLDEVAAIHLDLCASRINEFREASLMRRLAVCARIDEYEKLSSQLSLYGAVMLRPLTAEQCTQYFVSVGLPISADCDEGLLEAVSTPLMLNLMAISYQKQESSNSKSVATGSLKEELWAQYICTVYSKKQNQQISPMQVLQSLSWLGKNLLKRSQTMFFLDNLQPDYLPKRSSQIMFKIIWSTWMSLSVAIFFAIMAGIIEMLGRFAEGLTRKTPHDLIFNWRFAGIIAILTGVSTWLIYIIMENKIKYDIVIKFYASKQSKYILISGGIAGIIGALSSIYRDFIVSILNFSVGASMIGLAILVTLLISLKIDKRYNESIVMESNYHNQILFKSLKISLQMTFFVMFLAIIILMLFWLELGFDLRVSILILALMTCLMFMCGPHTQYVLLRLFLAHSRCAPLRLVQFLDFCSNRILLRNVGSGYLFIHRLLLEYFAALSKEDMKRLAGRMKRVT